MKAAALLASIATIHPASPPLTPVCGCATQLPGPHDETLRVDAALKDPNVRRLRRIEGQVRGLQRMVEDNRYCADIMTQISSVHEALRAVGRELMRNHLRHCANTAQETKDGGADPMYDELIEMMYRLSR